MCSLFFVLTSTAPVGQDKMDETKLTVDDMNSRIRRAAGHKKYDWVKRRFGRSVGQPSLSLETQHEMDLIKNQEAAAGTGINFELMHRRFARSVPAVVMGNVKEESLKAHGDVTNYNRERRDARQPGKNSWINRRPGRSAPGAI